MEKVYEQPQGRDQDLLGAARLSQRRSEEEFKKRIQLGREEKRILNVKMQGLNTFFWPLGKNNIFPLGRWCMKSSNLRQLTQEQKHSSGAAMQKGEEMETKPLQWPTCMGVRSQGLWCSGGRTTEADRKHETLGNVFRSNGRK